MAAGPIFSLVNGYREPVGDTEPAERQLRAQLRSTSARLVELSMPRTSSVSVMTAPVAGLVVHSRRTSHTSDVSQSLGSCPLVRGP